MMEVVGAYVSPETAFDWLHAGLCISICIVHLTSLPLPRWFAESRSPIDAGSVGLVDDTSSTNSFSVSSLHLFVV